MIEVYFGSDPGYCTHKANKDLYAYLSEEEIENISKYDAYKDSLEMILEDCMSMSLFGDKKTIMVYNAYFLTSETRRGLKLTENEIKAFIEYIKDPSPDTDLILIATNNIDSTSEIIKAMKEASVTMFALNTPTDEELFMLANQIAKKENATIDKAAITMLIERTKGDYLSFMNNITKLFTYSDMIREDDVRAMVYKPLEDNLFDVVTNLISGKTARALEIYDDLIKGGNDPLGIIPVMASQFRFMAMVKILAEQGEDNNSIANEISAGGSKVSPGRVYYAKKETKDFRFRTLVRVMADLGEIEKDIKLNLDNADLRLKLFISTFRKSYIRY